MPRNVEIKARVRDLGDLEEKVRALATSGPDRLFQVDQFFHSPAGRLKLRRCGDGRAELIFYRRPDQQGPAVSDFKRVPVEHADELAALLASAAGAAGEVRKSRTLYLIGRTRVHLDRVQGLGQFLELEVMLHDGAEQAGGEAEAQRLMSALGIERTQLVEGAYIDLLPGRGVGSEPSEF